MSVIKKSFVPLMLVLASLVLAAWACLQNLDAPFISDDQSYITNNAKLQELQFAELWRLMVEPYNRFEFLPLRDFSYWLDIRLFGLEPTAFRAHNLLLYVLDCLLVYAITLKLWKYFRPLEDEGASWAAAVVTALFALHPAHVEAVVWVSGRKDVLAGLFSLLAIWFAASAGRKRGISPAYAGTALAALMAAMLSKGTAVVVAPAIALIWTAFWRDIPAVKGSGRLLLWALTAIVLAVCLMVIFTTNSAIRAPAYWGVEAVTRTLAVVGWMVRLALTPEARHFFYPVLEGSLFPFMVAAGAIALLGVAWSAVLLYRQRKSLEACAMLMFGILSLPYLQLLPYYTHSLVTDRFLFLTVWPIILLLTVLAWRLRPVLRAIVLLAVALPWAYQMLERPKDWRSYETFSQLEIRAHPGHYTIAADVLGMYLVEGRHREASEIAGSITTPEIRNVLLELIQVDYALHANSLSEEELRGLMGRLENAGGMLQHPPAQISWNIPMRDVWTRIEKKYATLWELATRGGGASLRY